MTKNSPEKPDEKRSVDPAAAYAGAMYRLMPAAETEDRQKAAAAALTEDSGLFAPDWEKFSSQRLLRLREAVALSLGIDPDHFAANPVWLRKYIEHVNDTVSKRLRQYLGVLKEATFDIRSGELLGFGSDGQLPEELDVKIDSFGIWAAKQKLATHSSFVALYAEDPPETPASRPRKKGDLQEEKILSLLRAAGENPERLRRGEPGREDIKGAIRKQALSESSSLFPSLGAFDKVWDRLRQDGRIRDAT